MGTASKIVVLCGLCLLSGAVACCWVKEAAYRDGLKEGWRNGREYEREIWEKAPPKVQTIEVPKVVVETRVEKVEQYIPIPGKVQQVEVERTVVGPERLLRVGCVGGCKCTEEEKGENDGR